MWKWTSEMRRVTIYIKALRFATRFYVSLCVTSLTFILTWQDQFLIALPICSMTKYQVHGFSSALTTPKNSPKLHLHIWVYICWYISYRRKNLFHRLHTPENGSLHMMIRKIYLMMELVYHYALVIPRRVLINSTETKRTSSRDLDLLHLSPKSILACSLVSHFWERSDDNWQKLLSVHFKFCVLVTLTFDLRN